MITDIDDYVRCTSKYKFAFYETSHLPEPREHPCESWDERERKKINLLSSSSDLIFVVDTEVSPGGLVNDPGLRNQSNIFWVVPAGVKDLESQLIPWLYHIWRIKYLYENQLGTQLLNLDPYAPKKYYFDAMLGSRKPHRVQVYHDILTHNLQDKILCSIGKSPGQKLEQSMWNDPNFFVDSTWEPLPGSNYLSLNQSMLVSGHYVQMPNVLPIDLFNQTAYSIICETWYDNSAFMVTEKLAKPIIGRRLFVVFAGAGYLQFIKNQGLKTFSDVIDESYDLEPDDSKRWSMAFDQVVRLCEMDQKTVLDKIRPIVDHNHQWVMSQDHNGPALRRINQLIHDYVNRKI